MDDQVKCPRCLSTQISADKKGFSGVKAVKGAVLAGPLGIAAGTLGSNKVKITCLNCGHVFNPGDKPIVPFKSTMSFKDGFLMMLPVYVLIVIVFIVALLIHYS